MATRDSDPDRFTAYIETRQAYVQQLRREELLDGNGQLRQPIVDELAGTAIPLHPWDDYCDDRPDPICKRIGPSELTERFLDIRGEYVAEIESRDLRDIQTFFVDFAQLTSASRQFDGSPLPLPAAPLLY